MFQGTVLLLDDQTVVAQAQIEAISNFVPPEKIRYASHAAEAMRILSTEQISLVFLDIEMPDTNGFSMAEYIETHHKGIPYVFLTGYANFAAKSYDFEPLDFLTKPIDIVRLQKTFERLTAKETDRSLEKIAVETEQGFTLVSPADIRYIAKEKRKIILYCFNGQEYAVHYSMDELETIFADYGFFRNHQFYLISLDKIISVKPSHFGTTYEAVLTDMSTVPVSRARYPLLKELLQKRGVRFV